MGMRERGWDEENEGSTKIIGGLRAGKVPLNPSHFGHRGHLDVGTLCQSVAAWRRANLPGVPGRLSCRPGHFSEGMVLAVNSELSGDPQGPCPAGVSGR